ncbi:MAG: tripartite tricarboxylate transporter substrate binding protein [Betaproteobacteria bacterium]|nr:tripartite tricarboxylate transporter substrate binding protein [Betaproteobacteria bacterium]
MNQSRIAVVAVMWFSMLAPAAQGQTYPVKPVRLVVPFPPGGGVDLTGRLLQQGLSAGLGQPVIIENRAGASGVIGAEYVARAAPDGYTLVYTAGSDLTLRPFVSKDFKLDVLRDFTPIASALESVGCIAVSASMPVKSLSELFEFARKNPGRLNFGSAGINASHHLIGESLKQFGIDMVHVPFNGLAPAVMALVGGQIEVNITNVASVAAQVRDGKVKILGITRAKRYADMPDIPTVAEVVPSYSFPVSFFAFFGPAELPQAVLARINAEVGRAVSAPEVRAKARDLGMVDIYTTPEQFNAMLRLAVAEFGAAVKSGRIQPQ